MVNWIGIKSGFHLITNNERVIIHGNIQGVGGGTNLQEFSSEN